MKTKIRDYLNRYRSLMTFLILILVALVFYASVYLKTVFIDGIGNPHLFFDPDNIANLLGQAAIVGTLACGMTLVIVSGNIDLSVGSLLGMLGALCSTLILKEGIFAWSPFIACIVVIACGALLGSFSGLLVVRYRIPAFIVTLGGLLAYRGILLILAKSTIPMQSQTINWLGSGSIPGSISLTLALIFAFCWTAQIFRQKPDTVAALCKIAFPVLLVAFVYWINLGEGVPLRFGLMLAIGIFIHILSQWFQFGRYVYAIGGNEQAAYFSGINVRYYVVMVFMLMGAISGIAGILSSGIQMASEAAAGELLELYAIAACVIGGCSLRGGKGSVMASVLGSLIMATIRNGLSCLGVGSAGEKIVLGVILVLAVAIDLRLSGSERELN